MSLSARRAAYDDRRAPPRSREYAYDDGPPPGAAYDEPPEVIYEGPPPGYYEGPPPGYYGYGPEVVVGFGGGWGGHRHGRRW